MSLLTLLLAAAAASVTPPAASVPDQPLIAPAIIDNNLEILGDALEAEQLKKRMFVDVKVNGIGPHRFLVDSGADRSVVSDGLAARLNLPAGESVRLQGMAGAVSVGTV